MTLNVGNSPYICVISPNSLALPVDYITVVEDIPNTYNVCRLSSSTFGQYWPTLKRGLSAIAELLVFFHHI